MVRLLKAALPAFFLFAKSWAWKDRQDVSSVHGLAKDWQPYWMEKIKRRGSAPYSPEPDDYEVRHFTYASELLFERLTRPRYTAM